MKKLPKDFSLERYGLRVRLVNEDDADFILSLRANPGRTKFMITLDNEIESQKKWIQEYKQREKEGLDYYFIFSNVEDIPIGVSRISHIDFDAKTGKSSSWITVEGLKFEPFKILIFTNEIIFNSLEIEMSWGEVHKNNSRAIKIFKLFGYNLKDNKTEYYDFSIVKNNFLKACENSVARKIRVNNN